MEMFLCFLLQTASVAATVLAGVFPSSPQQSQNKILRTSHSSPNLLRHQSIRSQYPLYKLNSLADAFAHLTGSNGLPQIKKLSSENRKDNFYSPTFDKFCTLKLEGSENQNRSMSWCELSECQPFSEDCTCSSCAYLSPEEIGCVLLHHLQQMSCNVHTVTTLTEIRNEGSNLIGESADHMRYKQKSSVVRKEHRRIALAIYPTASLLNHACDPDVIVR